LRQLLGELSTDALGYGRRQLSYSAIEAANHRRDLPQGAENLVRQLHNSGKSGNFAAFAIVRYFSDAEGV
jgi:hypothetical protein